MRGLVLALGFLAAGAVWAGDTRTIIATNAPLAYFAGALGGDAVDVMLPVPKENDPAFWQPTTEDILTLQKADLILLNGAGYEPWVRSAILPRSRLVDTTSGHQDKLIADAGRGPAHQHGPDGEQAHAGAFAFTTWLDPSLARLQMGSVAQAMSDLWPELSDTISGNKLALEAEITETEAALKVRFLDFTGYQILGSHPVYQYLSRAYELDIHSVHWEPMILPDDTEWAALETVLSRSQPAVMLWEAPPLPETRARLEAAGVDVLVFQPMANKDPVPAFYRSLASQL